VGDLISVPAAPEVRMQVLSRIIHLDEFERQSDEYERRFRLDAEVFGRWM
jgi:hypothetical protein